MCVQHELLSPHAVVFLCNPLCKQSCAANLVVLTQVLVRSTVCECVFLLSPVLLPPSGGVLTCNLTATNTGNVRLTNIAVHGDAVSCAVASPDLLWPGANLTCTLSRTLTQDDFELGSVDLLYPLNASALGTVSSLQAPLPAASFNVRVPQLPALEVVTGINPSFATWPGASVVEHWLFMLLYQQQGCGQEAKQLHCKQLC